MPIRALCGSPLNTGVVTDESASRVPLSHVEHLLACTPVELTGSARRLLALGERVLASVPDLAGLTALAAHIGPGASLAELVATLASARPSGIATIARADRSDAIAFLLREGHVIGATATGSYPTLGEWTTEFRRRWVGSKLAIEGTHFDPQRTFVAETVLTALASCDAPGTSFALLQGELQWLDDRLDVDHAPSLAHLLLEHARRCDERPRIEAKIEAVDRVVVPLAPPGERAARPTRKTESDDEAESGWDFFDDPDPAAEAEWRDARRIFELCDGITSVEGLVERSMLGRFRTLAGVHALVERTHIALMTPYEGDGELGGFFDALDETG